MLATQIPATLQSSSAEKPACPRATTDGSVDLRSAARFQKNQYFSVGIAQVSATFHKHYSLLLRSAVSSNIATG